jgi:hypothetical protein
MSKIDTAKFIEYLRTKWGEARECPMCGKGPWQVEGSTFQLMEYYGGAVMIGGPVLPIVPVTCAHCGHTVLVNALVSGSVERPQTSEQNAPPLPGLQPSSTPGKGGGL